MIPEQIFLGICIAFIVIGFIIMSCLNKIYKEQLEDEREKNKLLNILVEEYRKNIKLDLDSLNEIKKLKKDN